MRAAIGQLIASPLFEPKLLNQFFGSIGGVVALAEAANQARTNQALGRSSDVGTLAVADVA